MYGIKTAKIQTYMHGANVTKTRMRNGNPSENLKQLKHLNISTHHDLFCITSPYTQIIAGYLYGKRVA